MPLVLLATWLLAGTFALLAGTQAHAQALDEARLVGVGPDAVLQIRFNVRVQYQRRAPLEASDLLEIYFRLLGGDEAMTRPIEESLRVKGNDPAPDATIIYPVQTGVPVKKIVIRLGRKVDFRVRAGADNQVIEIVLPGLAPSNAGQSLVAPPVENNRFAILLQSVPMKDLSGVRAVPARLQDYAVFGSQTLRDGTPYYELMLGYFESQAAAQAVLATLRSDFPDAKVVVDAPRRLANPRLEAPSPTPAALAVSVAPAAAAAPAAPAAPAIAAASAAPVASATPEPAAGGAAAAAARAVAAGPDTELDKQAATLLAKARVALVAGNNDEAINALNQLLLLPPNKYSQDAQELVGVARERAGELAQAIKEYELYLRLYPDGDGATRVRQRLATLQPPDLAKAEAAKPAQRREPRASVGGSISQYYYGGDQRTQTTQGLFAGSITNASNAQISSTAQSSLTTVVDLNGRYRTETSDTRIVFRDSDQFSFIDAISPSINRMDAAYVDYRDTRDGLALKVGRQSGVVGGLVGRFDGAMLSYDLVPKVRLNAVAGVPVSQDAYVQASQRFEGLSVEAQNFAEHWGGSAFVINQTADGITDRRAVGADLRYFEPGRTLYALVDYDVQFSVLNAATLQGSYLLPDQTSLSILLDDRKAPTLLTSNGLLQFGCTSYVDYFANKCVNPGTGARTVDQLRQAAEATTANSHQLALDISRPFGSNWQASLDARVSSVGALPTVNIGSQQFLGSAATGNVLGLTAQATGSNLYSQRDINVFSVTRLHSESLTGTQVSYNNLNGMLDNRLVLAPGLAAYWESDATGQRLTRVSPGFHASYKLTPRMSLEGTVSLERARNEGPTQNEATTNRFFFLGYRYDLGF